MKKVFTILAILLLPLSIWAMTPVPDSDLSDFTGQAGVNINANVTMDIAIGTMAWGDSDGLKGVYNPWDVNGTSTTGGYIGIVGFNIYNLQIKGRTETQDQGAGYNYYNTLMLKPITIDVATSKSGNTTEAMLAGTTFVRFGLGALEISMNALQFDVSLGPRVTSTETAGATSVSLPQNLGTVSMGNIGIYINPWSYVDIFSAAGAGTAMDYTKSGVDFAVNVTIDHFNMSYLSWGDKDGFPGNVSWPTASAEGTAGPNNFWMENGTQVGAGYVGLENFQINGPIAINGTVQIDVTTASSGVYAKLPVYVNTFLLANSIPIWNEVALSTNLAAKAIADNPGTLGAYEAGFLSAFIPYSSTVTYQMYLLNLYAANSSQLAPIGVGSTAFLAGEWAQLTSTGYLGVSDYSAAKYAAVTTNTPISVVHISFPTDFVVNVEGSITAAVDLGSKYDFTTNTGSTNAALQGGSLTTGTRDIVGTLGDIYIAGFKMRIYQGSWVDIWAH